MATEGPLGLSAVTAARRLGIPVSSSFHTNFHTYMAYYRLPWMHRAASCYLRGFHNRTIRTFAPTSQMCSQLEMMGVSRLGVLRRGVDSELFNPTHRSQELRRQWGDVGGNDTQIVIHVGRLAAEKNLPLVLETFEGVRQIRPASRLILVGDGPLRASLERVHPEHVITGSLEGETLARHYASADVMLFPSLTETFGDVVTEAMASGLAVVAFDYAAANLHIRNGVNGLKVPYGREPAFTIAAGRLAARGQPAVSRLGAEARHTALSLSWDAILDRFDGYLRRAFDKSARHGIAAARTITPTVERQPERLVNRQTRTCSAKSLV